MVDFVRVDRTTRGTIMAHYQESDLVLDIVGHLGDAGTDEMTRDFEYPNGHRVQVDVTDADGEVHTFRITVSEIR